MKNRRIDRSGTLRGRRGIVVFVAGALALGLGVTGIHAALAGGSPWLRSRPAPTVTFAPVRPVTPAAITDPVPLVTPAQPTQTAKPTSDPNALADGVYPTYIRGVDVRGATITVDVVQIFVGEAAHQAAIEDGANWEDLRYGPLYLRNASPRLRTLPVARDVRIKLIGVCMAPSRWIGLTQLKQATTPFTHTFYYDVSVLGGSVERIRQFVAVAAC